VTHPDEPVDEVIVDDDEESDNLGWWIAGFVGAVLLCVTVMAAILYGDSISPSSEPSAESATPSSSTSPSAAPTTPPAPPSSPPTTVSPTPSSPAPTASSTTVPPAPTSQPSSRPPQPPPAPIPPGATTAVVPQALPAATGRTFDQTYCGSQTSDGTTIILMADGEVYNLAANVQPPAAKGSTYRFSAQPQNSKVIAAIDGPTGSGQSCPDYAANWQ